MFTFLFLILVAGLTNGSMVGTATFREGAPKVQHSIHQALDLLLFGLTGYQYPIFHGFHNTADFTLLRLHPDTLVQTGASSVTFQKPDEVLVSYPDTCFCVDFSGIVVNNWFFFTMSSYVTFTTCATSCNINLLFTGRKPTAVQAKIEAKYTTTKVKSYSLIARILGVENAIRQSLQGDTWVHYLNTAVQANWQSLSTRMLISLYDSYVVNIEYESGKITHSLKYVNAEINSDKELLELQYGPSTTPTPLLPKKSQSSSPAMEHVFSADFFSELYQKATALPWILYLTNDMLPANTTVRLDTKTFAQVIPDMTQDKIPKELSAIIALHKSSPKTTIHRKREEVDVEGIEFGLLINDWEGNPLLKGTFHIKLVLEMGLKSNTHVIRILPTLKKTEVGVKELHSQKYSEVIKGGMAKIIQTVLDEHYAEIYKDKTLGNGIALTDFSESPDLEKSVVIFDKNMVIAQVYYTKENY